MTLADGKRLAVFAAATVASIMGGWLIAALSPTFDACLVAAIAAVTLFPIAVRVVRRRFDLFDPLLVVAIAFTTMYAARPAAMLASDEPSVFKGYDVSSHVREALVVTLIGVTAFQAGYALNWARGLARQLRPADGRWAIDLTATYAVGLALLAALLFSVFLKQAGGFHVLVEMLHGRNSEHESLYRNSSAYLYGSPALIWPASLLLFAAGSAARRWPLIALSVIAMVALGIFAGGQGSRITIIPLFLAPGIYYYLSKQRRPPLLVVALIGYLVFTVGIAYFRETRTAGVQVDRGAELQRAIADPSLEFRELVLNGIDNDMFESLATELIVVPEKVEASPPRYIYRILAKPIPSVLWKGKPREPDEFLNDALYPGEQVRASSSTGLIGSFYLAGAIPAVAVGMFLFGVLFRVPWEYWRRYPESSAAQLMLAAFLMFIPMVLRGGVADTIVRGIFIFAPLIVAIRLCRVPAADRSP